jgi:hypothetical protein
MGSIEPIPAQTSVINGFDGTDQRFGLAAGRPRL